MPTFIVTVPHRPHRSRAPCQPDEEDEEQGEAFARCDWCIVTRQAAQPLGIVLRYGYARSKSNPGGGGGGGDDVAGGMEMVLGIEFKVGGKVVWLHRAEVIIIIVHNHRHRLNLM